MRKIICVAVAITIMTVSLTAQTKDFEWRGVEAITSVGGGVELTPRISICGLVSLLLVPTNDIKMLFSYFGARRQITDWWWAGTFVGVTANFPVGSNAFDISVWNGLSFFDGALTAFVEVDFIVSQQRLDYYGFYAVNYNLSGFNLGVHAEQVNALVIFGPQIGFSHGPWHADVQYHVGVQEENFGNSLRFVNSLNF